jgi:hypothetical protein
MLNMMEVSKVINKQTGLSFSVADSVVLRTGRIAKRASLKLGNMKLAVMFIEVPESFNFNNEIKDIIALAEHERVIIYTTQLFDNEMKFLKENRIGYVDDHGHFYFPLEIISTDSYESVEQRAVTRSPSTLNEFPIGFLFFKNFGLLEQTQADIGELIGKSAATVNLVLKRMEKEKLIVKTDKGYHLASIENYFERWRFIISQYKAKSVYGRFKSQLSDDELKDFFKEKSSEGKWALSGPRVETLLDDGYLQEAKDLSIFIDMKAQKGLYKDLKLIPSNSGEIALYPSILDLREKGQIAHEIIISAELLNSNNPRIKEAGQRRFEKYLAQAKKVMNERFGDKYF